MWLCYQNSCDKIVSSRQFFVSFVWLFISTVPTKSGVCIIARREHMEKTQERAHGPSKEFQLEDVTVIGIFVSSNILAEIKCLPSSVNVNAVTEPFKPLMRRTQLPLWMSQSRIDLSVLPVAR
eukprot:TRINITY_DN582_c0_g1_i2.p1 TRINITY_DN582_c0_g1~~TRINITY_DN582_c0_g1_i2.p1  ORF type:complete len:123 (-),score=15.32 TRINITY_DN582_c0_g1_i2:621-989(-)